MRRMRIKSRTTPVRTNASTPMYQALFGINQFGKRANAAAVSPQDAIAMRRRSDPVTQKIGDFYAACMDEVAINRRGVAAIQPELKAIDEVKSLHDLAPVIAHLQLEFATNPIAFGIGSRTDFDDATRKIAGINQGGLGLPDRDYYAKDSGEAQAIRERYLQHVEKVFRLLGESAESAEADAASVMRIEVALATASLTQVERRDPYKTRNKMTIAALHEL